MTKKELKELKSFLGSTFAKLLENQEFQQGFKDLVNETLDVYFKDFAERARKREERRKVGL